MQIFLLELNPFLYDEEGYLDLEIDDQDDSFEDDDFVEEDDDLEDLFSD